MSQRSSWPPTSDSNILMDLDRRGYDPIVELDPDRLGGRPVISGTRFPVAQLIDELAEGKRNLKQICDNYGQSFEKAQAALRWVSTHWVDSRRPLD